MKIQLVAKNKEGKTALTRFKSEKPTMKQWVLLKTAGVKLRVDLVKEEPYTVSVFLNDKIAALQNNKLYEDGIKTSALKIAQAYGATTENVEVKLI